MEKVSWDPHRQELYLCEAIREIGARMWDLQASRVDA